MKNIPWFTLTLLLSVGALLAWWNYAEIYVFLWGWNTRQWAPVFRWGAFVAGCLYVICWVDFSTKRELNIHLLAVTARTTARAGLLAFVLFCGVTRPTGGLVPMFSAVFSVGFLGTVYFGCGVIFALVVDFYGPCLYLWWRWFPWRKQIDTPPPGLSCP